jgi:hypothetical protein
MPTPCPRYYHQRRSTLHLSPHFSQRIFVPYNNKVSVVDVHLDAARTSYVVRDLVRIILFKADEGRGRELCDPHRDAKFKNKSLFGSHGYGTRPAYPWSEIYRGRGELTLGDFEVILANHEHRTSANDVFSFG